jgi:addiction module HigA family antidote
MSDPTTQLEHVGRYIRAKVIPAGMSVTEAAKTLGVGRPALSNLLNGNATLSPEMALRLEQSFGADRQELLDFRARQSGSEGSNVAARTYVPNFLVIKARQIHGWAEGNVEARRLLPVLLRKLVHSTGRDLRRVDFPGYDNAERKGWDGFIEAAVATPWIPEGPSGWEFGTNQDPARKAELDYAARLASVPAADRLKLAFVFVTPRNWPGKTEWAKAKKAAGEWRDVRALDASDLEQWAEESIAARIWLAEQLNTLTEGFETLDQCWARWTLASEPPMHAEIFEPSVTAHAARLKKWLTEPSSRPFVVTADSSDEALAFIACLFEQATDVRRAKDLAAIFESPQILKTLAASSAPFIPIARTEDAARELAPLYRRLHCIIVRPRNAVGSEPDIALDLLTYEAFQKALSAMGIERERCERLARESGQSPTILRRRLSKIDAIRTPPWAADADVARSLIPMMLVGTWQAKSNADCEIVSTLAGGSCDDIEKAIAQLLQFDDCPVWSVGQHRGVASKIDALFAISKWMTATDIHNFLTLAEYVLSESDPALELPEDKRWAAGIYGKVRNHSSVLRAGVCETLVILAVHGGHLFAERLGINVEALVSSLIGRLLTPLTLEKLLSHDSDLPRYAEAAPKEFLALLEADLAKSEPVIHGLLRPVSADMFSRCQRTGLLWALECLAWKPQNLGRVTAILAQLSRIKIDDNWMNKPIASLHAIYKAWMPQTAASTEERIKALEALTRRFPDIGWQVCVEQFDPSSRSGFYSYRPHWRNDASDAGKPVNGQETYEFARKALDIALAWPNHDGTTLGDLVQRLDALSEVDQDTVWDRVNTWTDATTDESAKAELRERIRLFAFTRRGQRRNLKTKTRDRAREAYERLAPRDAIIRHAWLFAKDWVDESADEMADEELDYSKRGERTNLLRTEAIKEVWAERGFDGVKAMLLRSEAPRTIGQYIGTCVTEANEALAFLKLCLASPGELEKKIDICMHGFLQVMGDEARNGVLMATVKEANTDEVIRLLRCAPFSSQTWRLVDTLSEDVASRYWAEVFPYWNRHTEDEVNEIVDRLLAARRPRAAFSAVHMDWDRVETSRLKSLLRAVATTGDEASGMFKLDRYEISEALKSLDSRAGVTVDEKAQIEFLYVSALDRSEYGIPNLERQISESPALFVQALVLAYRRRGEGTDPPEWRIDNESARDAAALAAHNLLDQIARIPGTDKEGRINTEALQQWLNDTRQLCAEHGRTEVGDQCIGQLLSRNLTEEYGVWPCRPICDAMEAVAAEHIGRGFYIGVKNARGAHWRREGGTQERELASKYRNWSRQLAFEYPYVSSVLESIAESYDHEAKWQDSDEAVRRRIGS